MLKETIIAKMIDFYRGNAEDISHFLKVYAFAHTIGGLEGLDASARDTLEIAAIVHDIACPLCREKYGNTHGKTPGGGRARRCLRSSFGNLRLPGKGRSGSFFW